MSRTTIDHDAPMFTGTIYNGSLVEKPAASSQAPSPRTPSPQPPLPPASAMAFVPSVVGAVAGVASLRSRRGRFSAELGSPEATQDATPPAMFSPSASPPVSPRSADSKSTSSSSRSPADEEDNGAGVWPPVGTPAEAFTQNTPRRFVSGIGTLFRFLEESSSEEEEASPRIFAPASGGAPEEAEKQVGGSGGAASAVSPAQAAPTAVNTALAAAAAASTPPPAPTPTPTAAAGPAPVPAPAAVLAAAETAPGPQAQITQTALQVFDPRALFALPQPMDFNPAELELLNRLYAAAVNAMVGSPKDLKLLEAVAPNNFRYEKLMLETAIRDELELRIAVDILQAEVNFLEVQLKQLEGYQKNEKTLGKILDLDELRWQMNLAKKRVLAATMQQFLVKNAAQKMRCIEDGVTHSLKLVPFPSSQESKLTNGLKANVASFRQCLEEALNTEDKFVFSDAYSVLEYLPPSDIEALRRTASASSRARHASRHYLALDHVPLSVTKREEYLAQIEAHRVAIERDHALAVAEIARLHAELPADHTLYFSAADEVSAEAKQAKKVQQDAQDALFIQQALKQLYEEQLSLRSRLTKEIKEGEEEMLGDAATINEVRLRMLRLVDVKISFSLRIFTDFCRGRENIASFDAERGTYVLIPTKALKTDTSQAEAPNSEALNAILVQYREKLMAQFRPLIRHLEAWDIHEDVQPEATFTVSLKAQVNAEFDRIHAQLKPKKARLETLGKRLLKNIHLANRAENARRVYREGYDTRFKIMMGPEFASYSADRPMNGGRNEFSYQDKEDILVLKFPEVRREKAMQLLKDGIPSDSYYQPSSNNNLLHLLLSNSLEYYDEGLLAMAEYLLRRGVSIKQLNTEGVSPGALAKAHADSKIKSMQSEIAQRVLELCVSACAQQAYGERFTALQLHTSQLVVQAKAKLRSYEEDVLHVRANQSHFLRWLTRAHDMLETRLQELELSETVVLRAEQNYHEFAEILRQLKTITEKAWTGPLGGSQLHRTIRSLIAEFDKHEVLHVAQEERARIRMIYEPALTQQNRTAGSPTQHASMVAMQRDLAAARAEAATATARAEAAEANAATATARAAAAEANTAAARAETAVLRRDLDAATARADASEANTAAARAETAVLRQDLAATRAEGARAMSTLLAYLARNGMVGADLAAELNFAPDASANAAPTSPRP